MQDNKTGQFEENDYYADGRASDVFEDAIEGDIIVPTQDSQSLQERSKELDVLSDAEVLLLGRRALFKTLVINVESGLATPQEMAILAGLIKGSGLDMMDMESIEQHANKPKDEPLALPKFEEPKYA